MPTEEEIRAWVRDEQAKIDVERQDACSHAKSGTLRMEDRVVICDNCGKELKLGEDEGYNEETAEEDQKRVLAMRGN